MRQFAHSQSVYKPIYSAFGQIDWQMQYFTRMQRTRRAKVVGRYVTALCIFVSINKLHANRPSFVMPIGNNHSHGYMAINVELFIIPCYLNRERFYIHAGEKRIVRGK